MSKALWRWIINAAALYVAARVVTGIDFTAIGFPWQSSPSSSAWSTRCWGRFSSCCRAR